MINRQINAFCIGKFGAFLFGVFLSSANKAKISITPKLPDIWYTRVELHVQILFHIEGAGHIYTRDNGKRLKVRC